MDRYGVNRLAVVGLKFDIMKDTEDPIQFADRIGVRYPLAVATETVNHWNAPRPSPSQARDAVRDERPRKS
jgi:hypothetical protein